MWILKHQSIIIERLPKVVSTLSFQRFMCLLWSFWISGEISWHKTRDYNANHTTEAAKLTSSSWTISFTLPTLPLFRTFVISCWMGATCYLIFERKILIKSRSEEELKNQSSLRKLNQKLILEFIDLFQGVFVLFLKWAINNSWNQAYTCIEICWNI